MWSTVSGWDCGEPRVCEGRRGDLPAVVRDDPGRGGAGLGALPADVAQVAVRMIHACGMTDLVADLAWSPERGQERASRAAGRRTDPVRRADGGGRRHPEAAARGQPGHLHAAATRGLPSSPHELQTTRSAAAVDLWHDHLDGSVVAIGNAPTALFRLLELIAEGAPRPAAILGIPVGFIGAAESKDALAANDLGLEYLVVTRPPGRQRDHRGRRQRDRERGQSDAARLWGVGLGPGDPELVTVKAARLIGAADVIAFHSARHGRSIARSVAAPYLRDGPARGAPGLPADHRDDRPPRRLPGRDGRLLRRLRRPARRASRRRPRRRRTG